MICELQFTVNGTTISVNLESSPDLPISSDIALALSDKDKRKDLASLIKARLQTFDKKTTVSVKLIKSNQGNCNVAYLRNKYGTIFPEGDDIGSIRILSTNVDSVRSGSLFITERVLDSEGREMFVINENDEESIKRLAGFLKIRQQLENNSFLYDENSDRYKLLSELLNTVNSKRKNKLDSIYDMLLDFQYHKNDYLKINNAYQILQEVQREIYGYSQLSEYSDPIVNQINKIKRKLNKNLFTINKIGLETIISESAFSKLLDLIKTKGNIRAFLNSEEKAKEISGKDNPYLEMFRILFEAEPEFLLTYSKNSTNAFWFETEFKDLLSKYGFSLNTINLFLELETYRGYKLYKYDNNGKAEYYFSREHISPKSKSKPYNSIDEMKAAIDNRIPNLKLANNSYLPFKKRFKYDDNGAVIYTLDLDSYYVKTYQQFPEDTLIDSIDVPIDSATKLGFKEAEVAKGTFDDFVKWVNLTGWSDGIKTRILKNLNTPEKAMIFLYKATEMDALSEYKNEVANAIINMIELAPIKSYYIESWTKWNGVGRNYKVILSSDTDVLNFKNNRRFPIVTQLRGMAKHFNEALNASEDNPIVLVVTSTDFDNAENGITDLIGIEQKTSRAFIKNGKVYINADLASDTDMIHEYTHILLAYIRSQANLRSLYQELLLLLISNEEALDLFTKLQESYKGDSLMDVMEEVFVKLFSEYVMGKANPSTQQFFMENLEWVAKHSENIFKLKVNNLTTFYTRNINTLFDRFSSNVKSFGSSLIDMNKIDTSIKVSNFITLLIQEGKIIENCNG